MLRQITDSVLISKNRKEYKEATTFFKKINIYIQSMKKNILIQSMEKEKINSSEVFCIVYSLLSLRIIPSISITLHFLN